MGSQVKAAGLAWAVAGARARRHEPFALALFVAGLLLVTGLPAFVAFGPAPADRQFMGIILNVPDTAQYLAWARASAGTLLIENTLTPERGQPVFFNLFWSAVGRAAALLNLDLPAMLQVARLVSGAVYLLALFWFVGLLSASTLERWTGFLVITLGGGLGWLLVVWKQFTGDLPAPLLVYVIESNTFLTLMGFPHQAMATGLMVLSLGLAALAFERASSRLAAASGLLALVLGLQHGYDLLHVYAFVGVTALVLAWRGRSRRPLVLGLIATVPSLPAAIYLAAITRLDPIWRGVLAQYGNAGVFTPAPVPLMVVFGLPLLLLIIARPPVDEAAPRTAREVLLRVWLVVGFLLLYVPTDFQIKMLAGWQVPVGILAARVVLRRIAPALRPAWQRARLPAGVAAAIIAIALVLPVNGYLLAWRCVDLGRHDYPYWLHRDDVAALRWLEANTEPSDVILSSLTIGQYIPSMTGRRAFLAHWAQTLDFYTRRKAVERFYSRDEADVARENLLRQQGIRFVIHGPAERALGAYHPSGSAFLQLVFARGETAVYRLREAG
jgi:hypothetical protein